MRYKILEKLMTWDEAVALADTYKQRRLPSKEDLEDIDEGSEAVWLSNEVNDKYSYAAIPKDKEFYCSNKTFKQRVMLIIDEPEWIDKARKAIPDVNTIVGIDPGLKGGLCVIINGKPKVIKMPNTSAVSTPAVKVYAKDSDGKFIYYKNGKRKTVTKRSAKYKADIDYEEFTNFILSLPGNVHVFIEEQGIRPGNSSASSKTSIERFGRLLGILDAIKAMLGDITINRVQPSVWKKYLDVQVDKSVKEDRYKVGKELSIKKAEELYQEMKFKDSEDGLAEALLIAKYGEYLWKQSILYSKELKTKMV